MATPTLVIEVVDTDRGIRQEFRFARTPVRLGRSTLNDLPLDRNFVSNCHGVIHFDGQRCEFVDLGSTNGTLLDGQRVAKNEPIRITTRSVITIGALELRLRQLEASDARAPNTHASYAFRPNSLDQVSPAAAARVPGPVRPAPARGPVRVTLNDRVAPLFEQYRASWQALLSELGASVEPKLRPEAAAQLLEPYPELAQEAEFRRWAGTDRIPIPRAGHSPSAPPPASFTLGMDTTQSSRAAQLIEYFSKAFLELRRGQRQFAKDLALPDGDKSRIAEIDDARSLIAYLLDPAGSADRLDELSRAYADIMLHQVALLNGVAAGARELLEQLSPVAIARRHAGALQAIMRLFGQDARWRTLQRRFEDLQEETALSSLLLGRAFGRAYASSMGQSQHSGQTDGGRDPDNTGATPTRNTDRI